MPMPSNLVSAIKSLNKMGLLSIFFHHIRLISLLVCENEFILADLVMGLKPGFSIFWLCKTYWKSIKGGIIGAFQQGAWLNCSHG